MHRIAIISDCEQYRYELGRVWDSNKPNLTFVMLNPSTADAYKDDPTIKRCIGFAKDRGYGSITVVNLFAYRATNPKKLRQVMDPVGPANDQHIINALSNAGTIVFAWGDNANGFKQREFIVSKIASNLGKISYCLGVTGKQQPRHPLYIAADCPFVLYK